MRHFMYRIACATPALALAACAGRLSTLEPAGPAARVIAELWWIMLAGAAVLCAVVFVPLALSFRPRPILARRGTRFWLLGLGLGMTSSVLAALTAYAFFVGRLTLPLPGADVVRLSAHADQYRWTFAHPGSEPSQDVTIEGVLHMPAGRPVDLTVTATDVIHSFWVPRLAGKIDAIPGRENVLRLFADRPGTYGGICAEYCGTGHSGHVFSVTVHDAESWNRFAGERR